jgi:hypothetical protein
MPGLSDEQQAKLAACMMIIGDAQTEIMHGLGYLATEYGGETLPHLERSVAAYTEWVEAHLAVLNDAQRIAPRPVLFVTPIELHVL